MAQRATSQIFGDDVWAGFVLDRYEFEDEGMVEFTANFLLALKSGEVTRVGFIPEVGDLDRDELVVV
jgi:hypothetical protein